MAKNTVTQKVKKKATSPPKTTKPKTSKAVTVDTTIFPIGKLKYPEEYSETVINKLIQDIRVLPEHLKSVAKKSIKRKSCNTPTGKADGRLNRLSTIWQTAI